MIPIQNSNISMVIFLPNDRDPSALPKLEQKLMETQKNFDAMCEAIRTTKPSEVLKRNDCT